MVNKYICIHGHFYQPPRENPWLEAIEYEGSARPYHDWNERITEESYAPNSASRILNGDNQITNIVNNYDKISFNFGPTLLSWIKEKNPELLTAIIEADVNSQQRFDGHGNALAQAYNHMIMPLANSRDKYTQLYWGIKDFEFYFKRKPEGLWLPETAVDLETLDLMSELGIKFTILAPNQAKQIRHLDSDEWTNDLSCGRPYIQYLPSGRSITLFFYDGELSKAVAFERLLTHGEDFANRLLGHLPPDSDENYLVHIATDGETYGHHHHYGDMGLAFALQYIEQLEDVNLTNYAQYMEIQPAEYEVEIHEDSSWSCAHGIERWRNNCGCNNGMGWQQEWRKPLREALDWLRDETIPLFEEALSPFVNDPWAARNDYIEVIHDRSKTDEFIQKHVRRELHHDEKVNLLKWMELQRHAMLMYTSCGWFFDELSGIETVQVIKYAGRVIQLTKELTQRDLETGFIARLAVTPSNLSQYKNGAKLYELFVKPACINLYNVSAHIAASLPFEQDINSGEVYSYIYELQDKNMTIAGKTKLITGILKVSSKITLETMETNFAVLYQGDQNLICAIHPLNNNFKTTENHLHKEFGRGDIFHMVSLFEHYFGTKTISLRDLFFDMKMKIMHDIMATSVNELEINYQNFLENNLSMLDFNSDIHIPLPKAIGLAINYTLNANIIRNLSLPDPDPIVLQSLLDKVNKFEVSLDEEAISFAINQLLKNKSLLLEENQNSTEFLQQLNDLVAFLNNLPFEVNFWYLQNRVFKLITQKNRMENHELFIELAHKLSLRV